MATPTRAQEFASAIRVDRDPSGATRVALILNNTSTLTITGLRFLLWPAQQPALEVGTGVLPGQTIEEVWAISAEQWRNLHREIAAVRIEYRSPTGRVLSRVLAEGRRASINVHSPQWPSLQFRLEHAGNTPLPTYRVSWWTPTELGVDAPDNWATGVSDLAGLVSPSSQIDGTQTSVIAILTGDADGAASFVEVPIDARVSRPLWQPPIVPIAIFLIAVAIATPVLCWRVGVGLRSMMPALVFVVVAGAVALALLPPSLLSLTTTPGGGDYASQFVTSEFLRRELLPRGQIYGWFPQHFAGLPLFLMYFPLAFLISAAGSLVAPPSVAFKVATFTGPVLLPAAWFLVMRWLNAPAPARWLGATAAIVFLLNEPQQVWGGNLASVLAGEFAQGLGFPLAWLAVAWAWAHRDEPTGQTTAGILLALSALAHAYAGVAAAIGVTLVVLTPRRWWPRLVATTYVALVAAGLLAWWLLPMFWGLPWTTASRELWPVDPLTLFPPTTWPFIAAAIVGAAAMTMRWWRARVLADANLALLWAYATAMFIIAQLAYSIGLVNIRFLPTFLAALMLAGAWEMGRWLQRLPETLRTVTLSLSICALVLGAIAPIRYLPAWTRWNMHGIEHAPGWRDYAALIEYVRSDGGGRVFYEHSTDHDRLGTPRAFELLPLLAGRNTLEGLYLQSALLAPSILYLQSELSTAPSCAVTAFECGRFNVSAGVMHARMLGADNIVAYSRATTDALDAHPGVEFRQRVGHYAIYRIHDAGIAASAAVEPVNIPERDWRYVAHDWWRAAVDLDVPLVVGSARPRPSVERYLPGALPRRVLDQKPKVEASFDNGEIVLRTNMPGHPVIVRVAYHPGWRADDESAVELVAPGLMLVTPRDHEVRLTWSAGAIGQIGFGVSVMVTLTLLFVPPVRRAHRRLAGAWPADRWQPAGVLVVGVLAAVAVSTAIVVWRRYPPVEAAAVLGAGQSHLSDGDFAAAERAFYRLRRGQRPMHDDAEFHLALTALQAGENDVARQRWETFLRDHPVSTFTAEVQVRLARLDQQGGNNDAARRRLSMALNAPLAPDVWLEIARSELAAMDPR